jgi:hypothetical protein
MRESTVINEWIDEGRLKERRANLLRFIRSRFRDPVPSDVREAVEGQKDLNVLGRWYDIADTADSLDAFRCALQQ